MLATVPCVTIAFFSKPPPPPPPPAFDVLSILLALAAILGTVLVFLLMRKSTPASNGSTAKSKKGRGARTSKEYPRGPLLILWGSQTGTAEGFGNELMREARRRGYNAKSVDLEEYTGDQLSEEKAPCVFLMATNGEGEPTDNAMEFYSWANDEDPSAEALSALRFAVFGLGNTQYEHFCFMGKWCHRRLQELGATALCAAGEGNDDEDIRADFEAWCAKLWPALAGGADDGAADTTMSEPSFEAVFGSPASKTLTPAGWLSRAFPKFTLYECAVSADRELCSDPTLDSGSVKHIELACAGKAKDGTAVTLAYAGADDLGVCCDGGQALAVKTAARLGLKPDAAFTLKPTAAADGMAPPLPTPCTVEIALRYYADLRLPSSKQMLSLLAAHCANKSEAQRLAFLASADGKAEYASYVQRDGRGLAELLDEFPSCSPPLGALLEVVPKLAPRYYTISSSPLAANGTVHLTVKALREPMKGAEDPKRIKEGVCSTQLGGLSIGQTAIVFVRPSAFRLPANPATPVVMVGPGTGVAPFRAFAQQLVQQKGRRTGDVRLYFGCRRSAVDYLYREELEAAEKAGAITALRTAFSREAGQPKVYVQQRIKEDAKELYRLMVAQSGHVYICGGTAMGREVQKLLTDLHVSEGGKTEAEAAKAMQQMAQAGRLITELWS